MEIIDCIQGTEAWRMARLGIVSASNFAKILAKGQGKTRNAYMLHLAAERLSGEPQDTFSNAVMDRGTEMEPLARKKYEDEKKVVVEQVGFIKLDKNIGCSSDGLILDVGGLEIKSPNSTTHLSYIMGEKLPSTHVAQVQGNMWVTDRKWWDFVSFDPRIECQPFWCIRVKRDEAYINKLAIDVNQFIIELEELTKKITQCPY